MLHQVNTHFYKYVEDSKCCWNPSEKTAEVLDHLSTFLRLWNSSEWCLNLILKKQTRTETILFRPEEVMIRVGAGDLNVHLTVEFPQGRGAHRPFLFPHQLHTPLRYTNWHTHSHSLGMLAKIALIYYCHTPSSLPLGSASTPPKHVFHCQCHTITS